MLNKFTKLLYGPHQVSFDITNKCNLRCLHCFNNSGENDLINDELSDDEVRDFIKSLVSLKLYSFCFCGGETLLRKDLLLECTKMLKSNGTTRCSMVTNGILATPSVLDEVSQVGMDAVQFSLDGLKCSHDRLRNSEGVFDSVIAAITYLLNNTNVPASVKAAMGGTIPQYSATMATVIIVIGPIMVIYPFFQKYFVKGLTVGSVKG